MFKAFQFRLYPTNCQKELISKHIGSSRFIYNLALETKTTAYLGNAVNLSRYDLSARVDYLEFPTQVRAMIGLAPDISQKQEIPEGENIWY